MSKEKQLNIFGEWIPVDLINKNDKLNKQYNNKLIKELKNKFKNTKDCKKLMNF